MTRHAALSRRSFLEKAALGAGATVLSPIVQSILGEAHGQVAGTKRFVVWLGHQGIRPKCITPKELWGTGSDGDLGRTILDGPRDWTMPEMCKALERWRGRMLLLDGFNNNMPRLQHTATYGALSCLSALDGGSNEGGGKPGGITIDQYVANKIGAQTKLKTVLWGTNGGGIFATGPGRPEPHVRAPGVLFRQLFGAIAPTPAQMTGGVDKAGFRRRLLLDGLRADVNRVQAMLAPPERRKLESYLAAIEEFEKRQKNQAPLLASCKIPAPPPFENPPTDAVPLEDWLELMNDMSILALVCGLTNVVGVAANNGGVHANRRYTRINKAAGFEKLDGAGHDPDSAQVPQMNVIHNYHCGLVARFVESLSAIKEGDRTMFDGSVIVYSTDNGDHHHSDNWRWPVIVVGDAGGKLKSDGRFLRYPSRKRALADLWITLSEALGVPSDGFGRPGNVQPIQGPLAEVLA